MIFKWMIIGAIVGAIIGLLMLGGDGFPLGLFWGGAAGIAFRKWIARTFWE